MIESIVNSKDKNTQNKKRTVLFIVIGVLLLAGLAAGYRLQTKGDSAFFDFSFLKKPEFAFDNQKFPDWVTSGNTHHDNSSTGEKFTAFMVTQCQSGSNCSELMSEELMKDQCKSQSFQEQCQKLQQLTDAGSCMVNFYHSNAKLHPDRAIEKYLEQGTTSGVEMREIGVKTLDISTPEGPKTYQLHQYDSNGGDEFKSGVSLGYASLDSGHIEIVGICDESSQLDDLLPVLESARLVVQS